MAHFRPVPGSIDDIVESVIALVSVGDVGGGDVGGGWFHACADLVWSEFTFSWPRQPLLVIKLSIRPGMYASPELRPPDTCAFGNLAAGHRAGGRLRQFLVKLHPQYLC